MTYDEIPGYAGGLLRLAERSGLTIAPSERNGQESDGQLAWVIRGSFDALDALYVYWRPAKRAGGRTTVYRPSRRTIAKLVKVASGEAQAWVCARRKGL